MVNLANLKILFWMFSVVFSGAGAMAGGWTPDIITIRDFCGKTVGRGARGGFLVFNTLYLPADRRYECRVRIQPDPTESSSTSGNYVLFHFSDFEAGNDCKDTNITVLDGNGINMDPIKGLKNPLCGANSSLTKDVTFRTQSFFMTLIFRRNKAGLNFRTKFNMTFLSFSEGPCGDENQYLFTCNNKRCVDKKFVCHNLNPCGDNSDCLKTEQLLSSEDLELFLTFLKYGLIIAFAPIPLFVLFKMKKPIKSCFNCIFDCVDSLRYRCSEAEWTCCRRLTGRLQDTCRRIPNTCRRWKTNCTCSGETQSSSHDRSLYRSESELDLNTFGELHQTFHPSRGLVRIHSERTLNTNSGLFHSLSRESETDDDDTSESETGNDEYAPPGYQEVIGSVPPLPPPIESQSEARNDGTLPSYQEVTASALPLPPSISPNETRNEEEALPSYQEITTLAPPLPPSVSPNETQGESGNEEALPSYHEATESVPLLPPSISPNETGNEEEALPSYHEATESVPPLPPSISPNETGNEEEALPSYHEATESMPPLPSSISPNETGNEEEALPSYHEATESVPPLPPSISANETGNEEEALPSYHEATESVPPLPPSISPNETGNEEAQPSYHEATESVPPLPPSISPNETGNKEEALPSYHEATESVPPLHPSIAPNETGNEEEALPSYHEATESVPPLPPSISANETGNEEEALPSYHEATESVPPLPPSISYH